MFLPTGVQVPQESMQWSGPETGLLCTGEDSPDSGIKLSGGSPGLRLQFVAKDERRSARGKTLILRHTDRDLHLDVQSHYEAFEGLPVVRRHVEIAMRAEILYPRDLGITLSQSGNECVVVFPRARMGCILSF
jgi:hypothetical protein